jgi:hypothetical protein
MTVAPTIKITVEVQNVRYAGHLSHLIAQAHAQLQVHLRTIHGSKAAMKETGGRIPQGVPLTFVQEFSEVKK